MAIDLKRIVRGRRKDPPRVLIYSFDGVGKTGFAAGAPEPFFIDANKGSHKYDVQRVDVYSWDESIEWIEAAGAGKLDCKTIVLDAATDLEAFSHAKLFSGTTVTKYEGGYGKGDDVVASEWRKTLSKLETAWLNGIAIVICAHARVKKFEDPTGPGYERFEVACRPALAGLLRQWVDFVFFAREEVVIANQKGEKSRSATTGARWIYTRRVPAYDAKARGTVMFPEKFPLSWNEFAKAVENDEKVEERGVEMTNGIDGMLSEISDKDFEGKVRDYLKSYPAMIVDAHNRVLAHLDDVRKQRSDSEAAAQPAA